MKKISPIFLRVILCVCLLGYIFCRDATAETATFHRPDIEYPTGAVTVICPYAAGGGTDLLARVFAEFATKKTGYPFVVTNVVGGGTAVGATQVFNSAPDGYTILFSHTTVEVCKYISQTTDFDYTGFETGPRVSYDACALFTRKDAPYKTLKELVEYSRNNPNKVIAAMETGAHSYGYMRDVMQQLGVEWKFVDAGGNGPKISAMLGGHIDIMPNQIGTIKAYLESGDFICLGIADSERSALYPEYPTMVEEGYNVTSPGYAFTIFLPKGTDRNIVDFYDWLIYEMSNNASAIEAAKNIGNTLTNWLPSKQNEQSFAKYAETYADIAKTLE